MKKPTLSPVNGYVQNGQYKYCGNYGCGSIASFRVDYPNDWKNMCLYHTTLLCRSLGMPDPEEGKETRKEENINREWSSIHRK